LGYRTLKSKDAYWRRSNQMSVLNTDLAKQLEADTMGARLWRIEPGQASTRHRHRLSGELYVLLEGRGRLRVDEELLDLEPLDSVFVEPDSVRQPFNDTDADQLWLVVGAPTEPADSTAMDDETMAFVYPDGPKATPPELGGR
jgi:quercetin dioxygenase-like cupin family protein